MTTKSAPADMQVGAKVVVNDPDSFVAEVRNKVKGGRVGEIVRVHDYGSAAVVFPQVGRRKEYRHAFRFNYLSLAEPAPALDADVISRKKPGM